MHEQLTRSIREKGALTEREVTGILHFFVPKKLRKKQFLLNEGDLCHYLAFVEKGFLRTFSTDDSADEHVIQFSMEGWWVTDMGSFLSGDPALYSVEAMEDCELFLLTRQSMEEMMETERKMERYFRMLMQNNIIALQRRLLRTMKNTAEENYLSLLQNYPDIVQRSSQQDIASYLGITPETLSRIRKQVMRKK